MYTHIHLDTHRYPRVYVYNIYVYTYIYIYISVYIYVYVQMPSTENLGPATSWALGSGDEGPAVLPGCPGIPGSVDLPRGTVRIYVRDWSLGTLRAPFNGIWNILGHIGSILGFEFI